MEIDIQKVQDAIVREAADHIISDDDLYERVKRDVDKRVDNLFASRVETLIADAIDGAVKSGFEREYLKRNSFGQPEGAPTTIGKELERLIGDYWNQKVDRSGKASTSYGATTRAEWMMTQICGDSFSDQMKPAMISATAHLKDGLRAELRKSVDGMLGDLFHVRSQQDQAEGRYK